MEYKIKEEVLQATLNYLAQRQYSEVANLITALSQLPKIVEEKKEVIKEVKKDSEKKKK